MSFVFEQFPDSRERDLFRLIFQPNGTVVGTFDRDQMQDLRHAIKEWTRIDKHIRKTRCQNELCDSRRFRPLPKASHEAAS